MFSSSVICSLNPPVEENTLLSPTPSLASESLNEVTPTEKKSQKLPSPPQLHLESIHRLIKLYQQENRHNQFLRRALHKRTLRSSRRKKSKSLLGAFLSRGRKIFRTFCKQLLERLHSLKSKATSLVHQFAASIKRFIIPWVPWNHHHRILHCNAHIFSYSSSTEAPGPTRFDTDSILVGADVCASASVSQHKHLFTDLTPVDNCGRQNSCGGSGDSALDL